MPGPTIRRSCIAACVALAATAWAADMPKQGTVLQTTAEIKLRDAPPEQRLGLFVDSPGKEIHVVPAGTDVQVQAVDTVTVPFDQHTWVKVQTPKGDKGWAYFGSGASSANFKAR